MDDPAKHAGIATVTQPRFPAGSESRSPFFIGGRGHNEPPALRLRDCELDDIRGADVHVSNRPARQRLQIFLRQCIHVGLAPAQHAVAVAAAASGLAPWPGTGSPSIMPSCERPSSASASSACVRPGTIDSASGSCRTPPGHANLATSVFDGGDVVQWHRDPPRTVAGEGVKACDLELAHMSRAVALVPPNGIAASAHGHRMRCVEASGIRAPAHRRCGKTAARLGLSADGVSVDGSHTERNETSC